MPEGPTIALLRDATSIFTWKRVLRAEGRAILEYEKINNQTIKRLSTWGKHLLIEFESFYLDIHLMLFGSCLINESKKAIPSLHLELENGELNFYACRILEHMGAPSENFDYTCDVLDSRFNKKNALAKMLERPDELICDVLLDQTIFSGVGNKLKDEILFSTRVQPHSKTSKVPLKKKKEMVDDAVALSAQFLTWTREGVLTDHLLAHTKKICPRDNIPFTRTVMGKAKRSAYYCTACMQLYE